MAVFWMRCTIVCFRTLERGFSPELDSAIAERPRPPFALRALHLDLADYVVCGCCRVLWLFCSRRLVFLILVFRRAVQFYSVVLRGYRGVRRTCSMSLDCFGYFSHCVRQVIRSSCKTLHRHFPQHMTGTESMYLLAASA